MAKSEMQDAPKSGRKISHFSTPVGDAELEFIKAIEDWKHRHNQPHPSWTEVFSVFMSLGYSRAGSKTHD